MNILTLVGEVTDRPFRPGEGNRTVVKLRVGRGQTANNFEFDAFGQTGDFGIGLYSGDVVAVTGRLEQRTVNNGTQLRIVAQFIELITKSSNRSDRKRYDDRDPNTRDVRDLDEEDEDDDDEWEDDDEEDDDEDGD